VGREWGCREGWLGCKRNGKGRRKTCFSAGYTLYTVYVQYFKDIRQGAQHSYCVWFVTSSVGPPVEGKYSYDSKEIFVRICDNYFFTFEVEKSPSLVVRTTSDQIESNQIILLTQKGQLATNNGMIFLLVFNCICFKPRYWCRVSGFVQFGYLCRLQCCCFYRAKQLC